MFLWIVGVLSLYVSLPFVKFLRSDAVSWHDRYVPRGNFTEWVHAQNSIALERLLDNFIDENGAILASPSRNEPDYYYQWVRDSAIVVNTLVKQLPAIEQNLQYDQLVHRRILQFLNNSFVLQRLDNLSGKGVPTSIRGLGEPKFNVDNTQFNENWGRPQNDGPPLRIITILNYLQHLNNTGKQIDHIITHNAKEGFLPFKVTKDIFDNILFWDLQFIVDEWKSENFDLWEEVRGHHFFTSVMQLYAIERTLPIAKQNHLLRKKFVESLVDTRHKIREFILDNRTGFISKSANHIISCPEIYGKRSGLDIATILASIYTHDGSNTSEHLDLFHVDNRYILNTLYGLTESMSDLYPINRENERHSKKHNLAAVALGRYPEDVYDGVGISEGNPWYLATAAAAEHMYKLARKFIEDEKSIPISPNDEFWKFIIETNSKDKFDVKYHSHAFNETIKSFVALGDSFLDKIRLHVADDGSMSEQINKYTGYNQGASDLTWSYGSYLNAYQAREEILAYLSH